MHDLAYPQIREPVHGLDEDELYDQEIRELLQRAEHRLNPSLQEAVDTSSSTNGTHHTMPRVPKLDPGHHPKGYITSNGDIAQIEGSRILGQSRGHLIDRAQQNGSKHLHIQSGKLPNAKEWFSIPATKLTPELKQDFQLLMMRSVLDPKRHYKMESRNAKIPPYSQVGTIVQGPTEFYNGRIMKRDRKKTFVDEVMTGEASKGHFERKYSEVQTSKTSGKKAHYKALKDRRSKSMKRR